MSLFFLSFNYSFAPDGKNTRVCKLYFKKNSIGEFIEATPDEEEAVSANFSETLNRFQIWVGGILVYEKPQIIQVTKIDTSPLSGDIVIGGSGTTEITVPLKSEHKDKTINIRITSLKPRVQWTRFAESPDGGTIEYKGYIRTKVLPASALRIHQIIDQPMPNRNLFLPYSGISQGAAQNANGYGVWNVFNLRSGSIEPKTKKDWINYYRYTFDMTFQSRALEFGPTFGGFTIIEQFAVTATVAAFAVLVPSGIRTIESQRLTYNYYSNPESLHLRILDNFKSYQSKFLAEGETLTGLADIDHDGTITVVDRLLDLSQNTPTTSIDAVDMPKYFDEASTAVSENLAIEFSRTGASRELAFLCHDYSVIGKPVSVTGIEIESKSESHTSNFGVEIYRLKSIKTKIKNKDGEDEEIELGLNAFLIYEDYDKEPLNLDLEKAYVLFAKCIVPQWDVQFSPYNRNDAANIYGIKNATMRFIKSIISQPFGDLSKLTNPSVFFVIRSKFVKPIINSVFSDTRIFQWINRDYNDGIFAIETEEETDKEKIKDKVVVNAPVDDHAMENVGFNQTDAYNELIPGYGIKVRGSHGVFFSSESSPTHQGLANKIEGFLESPHTLINPYYINDIQEGNDSKLNAGSVIEIYSNMGFDKNVGSTQTSIRVNPGDFQVGLIGGNLGYIVSTVTETLDVFPVPSIVAFKSNITTYDEYITFTGPEKEMIQNYAVLAYDKMSFFPEKEFKLSDPSFKDISNDLSIENQLSEYSVQLDDYNSLKVDIKYGKNDDAKSDETEGIIRITAIDSEEFNNIGYIDLEIEEISSSDYFKSNGDFHPYVIFYKTDQTSLSNEEGKDDDDIFQPFGFRNNKGIIHPRLYWLKKGVNKIDVRNILNPTEIRLVPARKIEPKEEQPKLDPDEDGNIPLYPAEIKVKDDKGDIYQPKDQLIKSPIGHIKFETGEQIFFLKAKHKDFTDQPSMLLACSIDTENSLIHYPGLYGEETLDIEPNYRLDKYITGSITDVVAQGTASKNKYYLVGYMEDCQILLTSNEQLLLIGFPYDEGGSQSNVLMSIPIQTTILQQGKSIYENYKYYESDVDSDKKDKTDNPDNDKFPFFFYDSLKSFIVSKDISSQRVAAISSDETADIIVLAADEVNSVIKSFLSIDEGINWKSSKEEFDKVFFQYQDKKNTDIKPVRVCAIKDTVGSQIYLFCLCRILSQNYYVVMKKIPMSLIQNAILNEDISKEIEQIKQIQTNIVIGDPKGLLKSNGEFKSNIDLYIGNSTKKGEQYNTLGDYKHDLSNPTPDSSRPERNLNNLQEIEATLDKKTGVIKLFYINNQGIRDCRISPSNGETWYSLENF